MRLLLDTHIVLAIVGRWIGELPSAYRSLPTIQAELHVSVATIWEVAIKVRLGKLDVGMTLRDFLEACGANGMTTLHIATDHVIAELNPDLPIRDPFDRLLLAQSQVAGLKLVTLDRALQSHPMVWQPTA